MPNSADPDQQAQLDRIADITRNARAAWFGLIGLCIFVAMPLVGHRDADFFAYGAETALPLVGVAVPVKAFFLGSAVLVAAVYIYLVLS